MARTDERVVPAMGSDAHVLAVGAPAGAVERAVELLGALEARWSRFLPASDVSRCNAAGGEPVVVSPWTVQLLTAARTAWRATGGRFDPTVADAMDANGYGGAEPAAAPARVPGLGGIEIDAAACTVRLPPGVRVDPGGIGKGLAADLVACALGASGAAGALVSVGGDVRVWGTPPDGDAWVVAVEHPWRAGDAGVLLLRSGAVATSSRLGRRWQAGGRELHHLVDPRTGRPADSGVDAVTAVAGEAWWAEAITKALFVDGHDAQGVVTGGAAVVWRRGGERHDIGPVDAYFRLHDAPEVVA